MKGELPSYNSNEKEKQNTICICRGGRSGGESGGGEREGGDMTSRKIK